MKGNILLMRSRIPHLTSSRMSVIQTRRFLSVINSKHRMISLKTPNDTNLIWPMLKSPSRRHFMMCLHPLALLPRVVMRMS